MINNRIWRVNKKKLFQTADDTINFMRAVTIVDQSESDKCQKIRFNLRGKNVTFIKN